MTSLLSRQHVPTMVLLAMFLLLLISRVEAKCKKGSKDCHDWDNDDEHNFNTTLTSWGHTVVSSLRESFGTTVLLLSTFLIAAAAQFL
jgi:hypothetical protein